MSDLRPATLARTVAHLQPQQVAQRLRLRSQRSMLRRWPELAARLLKGPSVSAATGWPSDFVPLDATTPALWPCHDALQRGEVELLGLRRSLGTPPDWEQRGAPRLWRYHLHYWDWAWGLAGHDDAVAARALLARLWRSWNKVTPYGDGDAWAPYVASLRAWTLCGLHGGLVAGSDLEDAWVGSLSAHAGFLRRHLELDVGGNHLMKNLKAMIGLGVFFGDVARVRFILRRLTYQIGIQVPTDGGHFERAPTYHCQVLGDLLDIRGLLSAADLPYPREIDYAVRRMRGFLAAVLTPEGTVPLLNDGYPLAAARVAALGSAAPIRSLVSLPDAGLVRAQQGGWWLLADVGDPCPDELPAHAHADTLGCLLRLDDRPVFVDTGTSTYEAGTTRKYERSTAAHNTVEIDGRDSTEVWGAFRAGRRARVLDLGVYSDDERTVIAAEHNGYRFLPGKPRHRRTWSLTPAELLVEDLVSGRGVHTVAVRWHLAQGSTVNIDASVATVSAGPSRIAVAIDGPGTLRLEHAPVASGYLQTTDAPVLVQRARTELPVRITSRWRRAA